MVLALAAPSFAAEDIVVGVTPFPHKDIMLAAKPLLAKEGYNLVIKEFTDYVQPNMQKASVVPMGSPLPRRLSITGIMPVTLEYRGMPSSTESGTDHHSPAPRCCANQLSGTKPCRAAPRPTPMITHFHTRLKMDEVSPQAKSCRWRRDILRAGAEAVTGVGCAGMGRSF